ncbi:MAG: hypothetical protein ACOC2F_07410 [Bacteroidota bacterium]
MKKHFWKQSVQHVILACALFLGNFLFVSCEDDYIYDDREPEWLGESIYDYLVEDGNYTYYVKLIEDVGYRSVLEKTGSKTVFVADDDAFERFFEDNSWGVSGYNQLSKKQKTLILNYGMLDNAYLLEMLANYNSGDALQRGEALRRNTSLSPFDSIDYDSGDELPDNEWWQPYKQDGMYLLKDGSTRPLVHFVDRSLKKKGITNEDFETINKGVTRSDGDVHIFDLKVIEGDITCKNGYIHVLEDVLTPKLNIGEFLMSNPNTQIFSSLMERFSAPYYFQSLNDDYKELNPDFNDSIFVKGYFVVSEANNAGNPGGPTYYPNEESVPENRRLPFSPGWNSYQYTALQADMAAVIAPSDAAMDEYMNSGSGAVLKERFGSWENIPDNIIMKFMNRHMLESFVASVPSRFDKLTDNQNDEIPITPGDVEDSYVGVNGLVYETNRVYAPSDYISVYAPVLFGENTRIFDWAINKLDYTFYLNSLESRYSLFVPTDEYFDEFIDPITIGQNRPGALKFWFDEEEQIVNATVYDYDPETGELGDSIDVIESTLANSGTGVDERSDFVVNRLWDMLENHIVVDGVEGGTGYYKTKGENFLFVEGSDMNLRVQGGGNLERNEVVEVNNRFNQDNGNTYLIDAPIQMPTQSIYSVLSDSASYPEFNAFFELLNGFDSGTEFSVFVTGNNNHGIDFNVSFLNTFHYTLYVPNNESVNQAIEDGVIKSWDEIREMEDQSDQQKEAIEELERFVRYHFQDNSILLNGSAYNNRYSTSTIKLDEEDTRWNTYKDKFYQIGVKSENGTLTLTPDIIPEPGKEDEYVAEVIKDEGYYNILVRDYVFNRAPSSFQTIDGSGSGTAYSNSVIETAYSASIHLIDNVLRYK